MKYRKYPPNGIFKREFRNNYYMNLENKDEFIYYEKTPIEQIIFDDKYSISWSMFTQDGLNYLLPQILNQIQNNKYGISVSLEDFIKNMTFSPDIKNLILSLKKEDLLKIKSILENILFGEDECLINSIGEYYLFLDLEFLEGLIKKGIS